MAISSDEEKEILQLLPAARTHRRQHSPQSPQALASAQLTALLKRHHANGTPVRALADLTGLTYHSIAKRIKNP